MPVLANAKHERFAQLLASGKSAIEAYETAGYQPDRGAASRLSANVSIQSRLTELQERAASRTEVTVAGLTDRLLAIAAKGEVSGDAAMLAVARASLMDAAKLNGLVIEKAKVENETKLTQISDRPLSEAEWQAEHTLQ